MVRFTDGGTQTGPCLGAPATGKYADWLGIGIHTGAADAVMTTAHRPIVSRPIEAQVTDAEIDYPPG